MNRTLVIAISILLAFCAGIYFWTEWQKKEFDASLPKPPAVEEQQVIDDTVDDVAGDTAGGHWHGDEWHAEPHNSVFAAPIADEAEVDFSVKPTASAEHSITFDEIEISSKRAEILSIAERYAPEWAEWQKRYLVNRAKEKQLREEWDALIPPGLDTVEKAEAFTKRLESLSDEEKQAFVKKIEELTQRGAALHEEWKALKAEEADRRAH